MLKGKRCAKINVKVLFIVIIVTVAIVMSLFTARHVRRNILSEMYLREGNAAFENEDWPAACKNYMSYLGRHPDDVEILKKYAKARMSIRPIEVPNIRQAIMAYRRVMQLSPLDEVANDKLTMLYAYIGNFEELAYITRTRLKPENDPNDCKTPLILAEALIELKKTKEAEQTLQNFIKELETLPDKHDEYAQACVLMSKIAAGRDSFGAKTEALGWLNDAIGYAPGSVKALASRARFYRVTTDFSGLTSEDRLEVARKDLETADNLGTENPRFLLFLGKEWIEHGELDRATAELKAAESLPKEKLEEHFFDIRDWMLYKYMLVLEIAARRGDAIESASLADEALKALKEKRHRAQILPPAINIYVATGNTSDANQCLDEYVDILSSQQGQTEPTQMLAYLRALVSRAEGNWYAVIDVLQSAVVIDASRAELWGLLAEAFIQTGQTRRAIDALTQYLRFRPQDPDIIQQLTKEYIKLRDWGRALKTAQLAESLDPTNTILKLLSIEASINIVIVAERQQMTTAKRQALANEANKLADLRKEDPNSVDIRILQAIIAFYLDDPNTAEEELKEAIDECDEPLRAEMQLSRLYYRTKRIAEAISTCRSACDNHSEVAEPWLSLSSLYVANNDYDAARSCLQKAQKDVVGKWEKRSVSISLALLELTHGDRASGISILSEVAAQEKREVRARTLLLSIREVQEDKVKAQQLVDKLRDAERESGLMWRLYQAVIWLASDEWRSKQQDIAAYLQYCIDSDPKWSSPPLILAEMYEKLQDSRRVEDIYRQALVRNPSATDIADKLVTLLETQRRFSDAEKVLKQIEENPLFASERYVQVALRAGDFSRAIDELKIRVSNNDRDINSRILLARLIYLENKDADQAFVYLKEAEAITPDSMAIIAARVSILKAEGQAEEAERILNDYVANRDDFGAYMMRGVYLAKVGEFERAEKDYRKLTTFPERGAMGYELLSNFYFGSDKIDESIAVLEEGLNKYPENLRLKRRLMKTLLLPGQDKQRAYEIRTALAEQLPQDPELMKIEAVRLLKESTPQSNKDARGILEDVIKLEPTAVDAHLLLIGIAMQEQDYETARDCAIRALGSNPNNWELHVARGKAELELGEAEAEKLGRAEFKFEYIQMATKLAQLVLHEDPNNAEARDLFVEAAVSSRDRSLLKETRTLIESSHISDPANEKLLISWARILISMGVPQDAIPELKAYCQTKKGSSSVATVVTLADLYRISGDMEQAKQRIEQAEKINPNNLTVIHARVVWLVAQSRFEELDGISSAYLSAKEQNPTALLRAASVLVELDSMTLKKEGLKLLEHAVTLSPTSLPVRLGLAFTLYQTGNAERAKKIYEELLEEYPNNIRILNDLAWVLQEHYHSYAAALKLVNRSLILAPDEPHLLDTRGTILSNMSDRLSDARKDFEKLVELSPSDTKQHAKALLQLGRVCVKLDDLIQTKQHLTKALEIDRKINVFTPEERSEIMRILQRSETQAVAK